MVQSTENDVELPATDFQETDFQVSVPSNSAGNIGFCLSAIGVVGWVLTLLLILILDERKDPTVPLSQPFHYILQVIVGISGMFTCGVLSLAGLTISASGLNHPNRSNAFNGVVAGVLGLVIAVGVIIWRIVVWHFYL